MQADLHGQASVPNLSVLRSMVTKHAAEVVDPFDDQVPNPKRPDEEEAALVRKMEALFEQRGTPIKLDNECDYSVSLSGWTRWEIALACLRMRKYDPARSVEIFENFCNWRRELNAHHGGVCVMRNASLRKQLETGKMRILRCVDRHDRPIVHIRLRFHDPKEFSAFQLLQLFSLMQESVLRDPQFGEMAQCNGVCFVQDGEGISFRNLDPRVPKELLSSIQTKTPFRVGGIIGLNLPAFARFLFRIVRPFLSAKLTRRVVMVSNISELSTYITPENLLVSWGGNYNYDFNAWVAAVAQMSAPEEQSSSS